MWPTYKGWYESGPLRPDTKIHRRIVDFALVSGRWIAAFVALWALAAGGWRAAAAGSKSGFSSQAIKALVTAPDFHAPWFVINVLGQAAGAFVAVILTGAAALLFGGALGFLFGLPRSSPLPATMAGNPPEQLPLQGAITTNASRGDTPGAGRVRRGLIPSPALSEIADWLTKIIVGVGLIQARDIGASFMTLQLWLLHNAGLDRFPLAGALVPCVLLGGLFAGFVLGWLLTSIRISVALANTADELEIRELRDQALKETERAAEKTKKAQETKAQADRDLEEAEKTKVQAEAATQEARRRAEEARTAQQEALEQEKQAEAVKQEALERLEQATAAKQEAQAATQEAQERVEQAEVAKQRVTQAALRLGAGYADLQVQTVRSGTGLDPRSEEAGRVSEEAGRVTAAVVRYLYELRPRDALAELTTAFERSPDLLKNALLRRWEACALGQIRSSLPEGSPEIAEVENRAYDALVMAKELGDSLPFLQQLMQPDHPSKAFLPKSEQEDDLESFYRIPRFRRLLALPDPPPSAGTP